MNFIKNFFLALFLTTITIGTPVKLVYADDSRVLTCGVSTISVSSARLKGGEQVLQDFLVKISRPDGAQVFKFNAENDFLALRCEEGRDGRALLLVNHYCSGSKCAESNFSIIDLKTFEILLSANDRWKGNYKAAESIIGKELKPFSCGHSQKERCYAVEFE